MATDVVGPLTKSVKGNKIIITATDLFKKFVVAKALPAQNAEVVAKFLVFDVFQVCGPS